MRSNIFQFYFKLFLLFIIVLAYVIPDQVFHETEENIAFKIENKLQIDQVNLNTISRDLQEILIVNGKKAFLSKALEYQTKHQDQFAFFLFENDSLELWTDNHIPILSQFELISKKKFQTIGTYRVLAHFEHFHQFDLVSLQIIKLNYPWQNNYLKNHLADYLGVDSQIEISDEDGIPVLDADGSALFYISKIIQKQAKTGGFAFAFFLLSFFVLYFILQSWPFLAKQKSVAFKSFLFFAILLVWYSIHFYLQIPANLFHSKLYSSVLYAHHWSFIKLGDLLFFAVIWLLSIIHYVKSKANKAFSVHLLYIFIALLIIFQYLISTLLKSLVFDSQIQVDLYQIASLDVYGFLLLSVIFIFQVTWVLLAFRWLTYFIIADKAEIHLWIALVLMGLFPIFLPDNHPIPYWFIQFMSGFGILLIFYFSKHYPNRKLMEVIVYLIFFTFLTAVLLNDLNRQKEKSFRETSAINLEMENDPYLEADFLSNLEPIKSDTIVATILKESLYVPMDDSLYHYIVNHYFSEYLAIYNINLIDCNENSLITLLPDNEEVACFDYFSDKMKDSKTTIKPDILYLYDGDFQYRHYIGKIDIKIDSVNSSCIFLEFVSMIKQQESGLPAILEKSHTFRSPLLRKYSYAFYKDGTLTNWRGNYDYKQKLSDYHLIKYHDSFFNTDNFQHYIYSSTPGNVLIISLYRANMLQKLASFAFVFLFFSILTFIFYTLFAASSLRNSFSHFQGRMQYAMIILLIFSFVLIGISSLYYIIYLNEQKNADGLMEKAHSVLIEMEHKLSGMNEFNEEDKLYVESLLGKFSEVFFTDITLYSRDGKLLASSRPEVFQSELLAKNINANAFFQLSMLKNSFFIQDEQIGTQKYLSAYLPFRNQNNKSVAYLNLPYFAKQYELETEVSGFIVAFLNIYLFLFFITIMITIVISRYLSRPLLLIKEKISQLNLQHDNEKLEWNRNDEIGELIREYNRMVDELERSAQKLAISQRESAWREMAQQIAHEIKNPLTPMKLNVQYLEKAWDDQADDYEERMKNITKALKEQIDVLAETAGQFSTFAAVDQVKPEFLNIKAVIENVVSVFKANEGILFQNKFQSDEIEVYMDKSQLIRVLNNIYKNAVQALMQKKSAQINSICSYNSEEVILTITDNGIGIPKDEIFRIFEPRFTTKSAGMGLGLALVKKMLEQANATISVSSEESIGSTFTIRFPFVRREDHENTGL